MPFKIHDDMPIPGKAVEGVLLELYEAVKDLKVGQCLEVDTQDMNWSNREPGFKPERKHIVSRLNAVLHRIRETHKNIRFASRPMTDTSMGLWRLEDKDTLS